MSEFVKVLNVNDLGPGNGTTVDVDGKQIAVFNVDGKFYAVDNTCPHRAGPLGEGDLDGDIISCPLHGWKFDVKTGNSTMPPGAKVTMYEVEILGEEVFVNA